MKNSDAPFWKVMFSPNSSQPELSELRHLLSTNDQFNHSLQAFLYSEWAVYNTKARTELNPELRLEYRHYANALAEIVGKLCREEEIVNQTTERRARL